MPQKLCLQSVRFLDLPDFSNFPVYAFPPGKHSSAESDSKNIDIEIACTSAGALHVSKCWRIALQPLPGSLSASSI